MNRACRPDNILDFISDERLLGAHFAGPSWARWRAILRATFALPMSDHDLELFHEVAGNRNPPTKPVRELVACVGRGGGKVRLPRRLLSIWPPRVILAAFGRVSEQASCAWPSTALRPRSRTNT